MSGAELARQLQAWLLQSRGLPVDEMRSQLTPVVRAAVGRPALAEFCARHLLSEFLPAFAKLGAVTPDDLARVDSAELERLFGDNVAAAGRLDAWIKSRTAVV